MRINLIKNGLLFFVITFFILSYVSPLVFCEQSKALKEDVDLENLAFICRESNGFNRIKYDHYKQQLIKSRDENNYKDAFQTQTENTTTQIELKSTPLSLPPMDSPWPMICHDNHHSGLSPYNAENTGEEMWRYFIGRHGIDTASPVIGSDGTIYFGSNFGDLFAVYPDNTLRWCCPVHEGMPIWSTPAIAQDGTIYVNSYSDALFAVDPNGTVKWHHGGGGSVSSPAVDVNGIVYYGNFEGYVFAIYPNGTRKWDYKTGSAVVSSPAINDEGIIYIGSEDSYLYALFPNGSLCWRFKTGEAIMGSPSIDDDGTVYIGSYDDYLYALYPNGTMKWRCPVGYGTETNPSIAADGTIYVGGDKLYAIYPDGNLKWSFYLGPYRDIDKSSPAVSADGTIFIGVTNDDVYGGELVAISPKGTEKWRKTVTDKWCDASPAIAEDGTVYITGGFMEELEPNKWFPTGYLFAYSPCDPNAPSAPGISGTTGGKPANYDYSFRSTSPLGRNVYYYIDWGDGRITRWIGPYKSGKTITVSHTWLKQGTFTIRARAKDTNNLFGPWGSLAVTMPVSLENSQSSPQSSPQSNPSSQQSQHCSLLIQMQMVLRATVAKTIIS